jgi:hypothetical protein
MGPFHEGPLAFTVIPTQSFERLVSPLFRDARISSAQESGLNPIGSWPKLGAEVSSSPEKARTAFRTRVPNYVHSYFNPWAGRCPKQPDPCLDSSLDPPLAWLFCSLGLRLGGVDFVAEEPLALTAFITRGVVHLLKLALFEFAAKAADVGVEIAPLLNYLRRPFGNWRQRQHKVENPLASFFVFGVVSHMAQHSVEFSPADVTKSMHSPTV